jgi:hypothetical protein
MITKRWDELHNLTGDKILLLAFSPPKTFSEEFESFWKKQLGRSFSSVWSEWAHNKVAHSAYNFDDMFQERKIRRTEMPCLTLFTSLNAKRAVILPIPDWSNYYVWKYLKAVFDTIDECASLTDPEARFIALERSLNSFPARAKATLGHFATKTADYVKEHPIAVVATSVSVVIALATASVIPIGAAGIVFMKDILKILKSAPRRA